MKKIRVAVLGAGAIARACHIPGYAAQPDLCELCAVADTSEESLAYVQDKWHFKRTYSTCGELLEREKVDLVSVCLPNLYHADHAIKALESGADVILEKPVATTLADAERIRDAVKRTGKRLAVCFSHRFNPMNRAAKAAFDSGKIGKPYMMRIRFAHTGPFPGWAVSDWFYDPVISGGGAVLDMGIHAFDLMTWFMGKASSISAAVDTLRKDIAVDDNALATIRYGHRAFGSVEVSWTSPCGFNGVEIYGDNGSIVVDYSAGEATMSRGCTKPDGSCTIEKSVLATRGKMSWFYQMAEFIECKRDGKDFPTNIDDGIEAVKLALAGFEAGKTAQEITL